MFIWLSGINPVYLLGTVSGLFPVTAAGGTFFSGFMFLLNLVLLSFFGLLLAYFLAESVVVRVDIAKNMRTVAKQNGHGFALNSAWRTTSRTRRGSGFRAQAPAVEA